MKDNLFNRKNLICSWDWDEIDTDYTKFQNSFINSMERFDFIKALSTPSYYIPKVKKIIFQKTHTIILWADNSKPTIVNCSNEEFDKEKGIAMAFMKKMMSREDFKRLINNAEYQDK